MRIVLTISLLLTVFTLFHCTQNDDRIILPDEYRKVLLHFKNDSLKLEAANFLYHLSKSRYSLKSGYFDNHGTDFTDFLSTYSGKLGEQDLLDSLECKQKTDTIFDYATITTNDIISTIEIVFDFWKNNPWKLDIPKDTVFEYLLPYRIAFEPLGENWRIYFKERYLKNIKDVFGDSVTIMQISQYLLYEGHTLHLYPPSHALAPAKTLNLHQILKLKSAWSCVDRADIKLQKFRALGIPAAREVIPLWGKFNYGHEDVAIMFSNKKFYPSVDDSMHFKYKVAKMYRLSESPQPNAFRRILDLGIQSNSIPLYFNNEFIDITDERTPVSDIKTSVENSQNHKVLYLCIYNGGNWHPVEWSVNENKNLVFPKMGRKMLYHIAGYNQMKLSLIGAPIILDTTGTINKLESPGLPGTITINKSDRNVSIVKEHFYALYYWDPKIHEWKLHSINQATGNLLSFREVPSNTIYRLSDRDVTHDPERPFTYTKENQVWW